LIHTPDIRLVIPNHTLDRTENVLMSTQPAGLFSNLCLVLGLASILASIGIWFFYASADAAHAERFGIFVGLWAPTFIALSERVRERTVLTSVK
jgi:hypothetical protein